MPKLTKRAIRYDGGTYPYYRKASLKKTNPVST